MSFQKHTNSIIFQFSTNHPLVFSFIITICIVIFSALLSFLFILILSCLPDKITKNYIKYDSSIIAALIASSVAISTAFVVAYGFFKDISYRYKFDQYSSKKHHNATKAALSTALMDLIDICERCAIRIYHKNTAVDMNELSLSDSSKSAIFLAIQEAEEGIADDIRKLPIYHQIAISSLKYLHANCTSPNSDNYEEHHLDSWRNYEVAIWISLSAIAQSYIPYSMGNKLHFDLENAREIYKEKFSEIQFESDEDLDRIHYRDMESASEKLREYKNDENFGFLDPEYIEKYMKQKTDRPRKTLRRGKDTSS